jgi:hypothetical protein
MDPRFDRGALFSSGRGAEARCSNERDRSLVNAFPSCVGTTSANFSVDSGFRVRIRSRAIYTEIRFPGSMLSGIVEAPGFQVEPVEKPSANVAFFGGPSGKGISL